MTEQAVSQALREFAAALASLAWQAQDLASQTGSDVASETAQTLSGLALAAECEADEHERRV